jgi:hypothetical protein
MECIFGERVGGGPGGCPFAKVPIRPEGDSITVDRFGMRAVVESFRSRLTDFMRLMSVESR